MKRTSPYLLLVGIWVAWAVLLIGFQRFSDYRWEPERPDNVLNWTGNETKRFSQKNKPYLMDPFMNEQVSWDSEFYLSIATVGYDDPAVRTIQGATPNQSGPSLNYAFFPLYPMLIKVVNLPVSLFGLRPIATSALSGVIVSLLGTLVAMIALYDMTKVYLGEDGGLRAAFYLLIFPTGFFLAQVYSEGVFLALAFGCIALARRGNWLAAAIVAALAVWTRPGGVALVIPLAWYWFQDRPWQQINLKTVGKTLAVLLPLISFAAWYFSPLGQTFMLVESKFFGRGILEVGRSWMIWKGAWLEMMAGKNLQTTVYYILEFSSIVFGFVASIVLLRRYPEVGLFGIALMIMALTSGVAQGMPRYILALPSVFILLARWGKNPVFDRSWTVASLLLMGLLATLFTFDFWVG